jgi:hypothetical protein
VAKTYIEDDAGDLREVFEETVLPWDHVTFRRMFGCPAYIARGALFALLVTRGIVLTHLAESEREALSRVAVVQPFQAGNKTVHRWAQINIDSTDEIEAVLPYVYISYQSALAEATE